MIDYVQIIILLFTTILTLVWVILSKQGSRRYAELIKNIDAEEFRYPELFGVGFVIMQKLKMDGNGKAARKRVKSLAEVYGKKYAKYYYHVMTAAKITYGYTVLIGFLLLGSLANNPQAVFFGMILSTLLVWYIDELFKDKLEEREDSIMAEFPAILSKLTLLVNSGMIMRSAWSKVAEAGDSVLYQEMKMLTQEQNNGLSDVQAYKNFADRCGNKEVRRFASMMIQNLQKGNAEMAFFLREMSETMWEEKMHMVKRKGVAAGSKLMIPTMLIFVGILVMIIAPALTSMNF